jgi:membrane associated rhomboid family serine protease
MPPKGRNPSPSFWSWSSLLIFGLVVCFVAQQLYLVPKRYEAYLALSDYGVKNWHLWELFTYQCFHSFPHFFPGLAHLLFNLLVLWFVGRELEARIGGKRFLIIWLGASLAGALLQGLFAAGVTLLPDSVESARRALGDRFGGPVAGASVGACGILATFCRLDPGAEIKLFFLIPVRAGCLLWVFLGLAVLFVLVPTDASVAHLANLGGLLTGMALGKVGRVTPCAPPSANPARTE